MTEPPRRGETRIDMTRNVATFALIGLCACVIHKPIGDADSDSATSSSSSDDATGPGMTSMVDTTGVPDDDPFRVDCAEQDWGTTVGGGELGPLGFPVLGCNPRTSSDATGYTCCSTDPSTADGSLPAYEGKSIPGAAPLYADAANGAGTWGACVRTSDIPVGSGLLSTAASNCPIPCNPTWADDDVETVCGAGRVCCQVHELHDEDCVEEDGVWRPVTGADIGSVNVTPPTNWNEASHVTHQDPNGLVCLAFAGDQFGQDFAECVRHLTVADQRGFCMSLEPGQICPGAAPSYVDACEAKNG